MRILSLFTRYGTEKYKDSHLANRADFARSLPGADQDYLIVDTALPEDYREKLHDGTLLLGASNDGWEFSAWNQGLREVGDTLFEYDYVQLMTSALYNGYVDFYGFLSEEMLAAYSGRGVALGHLEVYNDPVSLMGVRFQAWLRTSYLIVPPTELVLLGNMRSVTDQSLFFSDDLEKPFRDDAPLCEQYKSYIHSWLTGEGTGQGVEWHSRFALTEDNFPYYRDKAMAIFNEMSLTNRLLGQGCTPIDMTWLNTRIQADNIPEVVPGWYEQITTRGTGHEFIVEG